ncbi:MAG: adenylate/guanylate cyclase domain-containing protein, partial [Leptospiraceae bacterium]|nr:adenylate/guanylate cyclase domain-containing protein [Leptospiraceae bacterium]
MALFEKPDQAVRAARAMMLQLKDYNSGRIKGGYDPIQIGIGLHTGVLRLGIIGEEGRIEGTVIGDSVNLASRLEGLNRQYGTSVIVSETTGEAMSGSTLFQFRKLDRVRVKGKNRPVWIFEMLLDRKIPANWDRAISFYQEGNFEAAHKEFLDLRAHMPDDPVIELYTRRLQELKDHPPEVWEGIENLTKK